MLFPRQSIECPSPLSTCMSRASLISLFSPSISASLLSCCACIYAFYGLHHPNFSPQQLPVASHVAARTSRSHRYRRFSTCRSGLMWLSLSSSTLFASSFNPPRRRALAVLAVVQSIAFAINPALFASLSILGIPSPSSSLLNYRFLVSTIFDFRFSLSFLVSFSLFPFSLSVSPHINPLAQ